MGKIPVNNPPKQKAKYAPPSFKKGQLVFINAFLKTIKGKFFVCKCNIEEIPQPNQRRIYKVKIISVADRAVGDKSPTPFQASLLGRVITKRENELVENIADFMLPKCWINYDPDKTS